jgi:hypothetical protein
MRAITGIGRFGWLTASASNRVIEPVVGYRVDGTGARVGVYLHAAGSAAVQWVWASTPDRSGHTS